MAESHNLGKPVRGQPARFGKYILVEKLAQGGMAEIYRAILTGPAAFAKTVALKRILPGFSDVVDFRERFIEEARVAADLNHSNIVQVLEFGELEGSYYLAMELVEGLDCERLLRRATEQGQSLIMAAAFIISQAARGLAYAHLATQDGKPLGLVHRDVSPQNILVSRSGEVKLTDFGIAKVLTTYHHKTASGAVMGKLRYMAPEQVAGIALDGRADIFALGLVLWELIAGERLLDEDSPAAVVDRIRNADFPPPSSRMGDVPPELDRIVMRALEGDRDARYQTADEMARDLERLLRTEDPGFGREDLAALMEDLTPRPAFFAPPLVAEPVPELPPPAVKPLKVARGSGPESPISTEKVAPPAGEGRKRMVLFALAGAALAAGAVVFARGVGSERAMAAPQQVAPPVVARVEKPQQAASAPAPTPAPAPAPLVAPPVAPSPAPSLASAVPRPDPAAARRRRLDGKPVVLEDEGTTDLAAADAAAALRARDSVRRADRMVDAGSGEAAERIYQQALEDYPGTVAAYRGLGRVYAQQGNVDLAISSLKTYLKNAPGAKDAATVRRWLRQLETETESQGLR